ncbi:TetR/AcrR family transcriptional regulator [Gordonia sp. TBRC 11910]|uniref:TetR/AcrR family transcriptional regulator n=1 Tax=Gordonia asplenii TaxID=2725283 RepID=A0A848L8Q8_9ACTN|nr:TetR/AcrR family transcriptional regulator [Gordonia asplenii]NMO04861.1 TetR/AcrR family transcriptional regulator [Gordonia asplenii]
MSPRALDPTIRAAVTAEAIRILGTEGRAALTARRLARDAQTSTTAVYTYFGSMDDVHRHVRRHALGELIALLDASRATADPVADVVRASAIHVEHGRRNPAMYRVMFVDQPPDEVDDPGTAVFTRFAKLVDRCVADGRFRPGQLHDPVMWAGEIWAIGHGVVLTASTELLPAEQVSALHADLLYRVCVGFGDVRDLAMRSVDAGMK